MTDAERARQHRTARKLARVGRAVPADRGTLAPPGQFTVAEEAALVAFLGEHARTLRAHVERCRTNGDELRLAWLYRAVLQDVPGAWTAWAEACRALDVQ